MDDAQVLASMVLMNVMGRELLRSNGGHTPKFVLTAEQAMCCGASEPKEDTRRRFRSVGTSGWPRSNVRPWSSSRRIGL